MVGDRECTYCGKPTGPSFKYAYGLPGHKHVFKCDRRWCTAWQMVKTKLVSWYIKHEALAIGVVYVALCGLSAFVCMWFFEVVNG